MQLYLANMIAHNGRKYGSQQAKIEPIKLYDHGPARINFPVKPNIFRTADLEKVVISAMADFSTQRLILFFDKVRRDFFFSKRKRWYPTCQL